MKREDAVGAINSKIPLPKQGYAWQCIEEEFKESGAGNWMIVRDWQIINPNTAFSPSGQELTVAGCTAKQYLLTASMKQDSNGQKVLDDSKTKANMARVFQDYDLLGLPNDDIDPLNPMLGAKGKVIFAVGYSKEYQQTKDPTPEQLEKGQKQGDVILDENNKPMVGFQVMLGAIQGLSNVKPVAAAC